MLADSLPPLEGPFVLQAIVFLGIIAFIVDRAYAWRRKPSVDEDFAKLAVEVASLREDVRELKDQLSASTRMHVDVATKEAAIQSTVASLTRQLTDLSNRVNDLPGQVVALIGKRAAH